MTRSATMAKLEAIVHHASSVTTPMEESMILTETYALDSLDLVEIQMKIEVEFDCKFSVEEDPRLYGTVGEIIDLIEGLT